MNVIQFRPSHLDYIKPRDYELDDIERNKEIMKHNYEVTENEGYTVVHDGAIICCGGVYNLWDGVGEAWVLGSDLIQKYKIGFHKAILTGLKRIISTGKFHRVQSVVRVDLVSALCWPKMLGFEMEGKLKKYTRDGVDCFIYSLRGL